MFCSLPAMHGASRMEPLLSMLNTHTQFSSDFVGMTGRPTMCCALRADWMDSDLNASEFIENARLPR